MKLGRRENDSLKPCSLERENDAVGLFLSSPWCTSTGAESGAPLPDIMDWKGANERGYEREERTTIAL